MNLGVPQELIDSVGLTLLHFIWQGALVGIVVWLALQLCPIHRARLRYGILCIGMLALVTFPIATLATLTILQAAPSHESVALLDSADSTAAELTGANPVRQLSPNESVAISQAKKSSATDPIEPVQVPEAKSWVTIAQILSPWLTFCWAIGVVVLSLRMIVGWNRTRELRTSGQPFDSDIFDSKLDVLKKRLGIKFDVRLCLTKQIDTPTVIGWFKPVILLPISAVTGLSVDQVAAVLAHELAHIRRHDYLINLAQSVVEVMLFYHPVVWWMSGEMRKERENCCDDLALAVCSNARDYVDALLSLEQQRSDLNAVAVAASGGSLLQRASRILGQPKKSRRSTSFVCGFTSLIVACLVLTCTIPNQASSSVATQDDDDLQVETDIDDGFEFQILVVDAKGEAIPDASLYLSVRRDNPSAIDKHDLTTGADGFVGQDLSSDTISVRAWCRAKGYAPVFANWEPEYFKSGKTLPEVFSFVMLPAATIGGRIVDEKGKPIEGVKVQVTYRSGGLPLPGDRQRYNTWLAYGDAAAVTDADGRWSQENIPPGDDVNVSLTINHPDYASDERTGEIQSQQSISMKDLAQQNANIVMKKGAQVHGTVTKGKSKEPITDALVIWGDRPYFDRGSQEVKLDKKGQFKLPTMKPGKRRITVLAPGFKPETRIVDVRPDMPATDFQMQPGKKLQIQFTDPDGEPIPGVYVSIQEWRGSQAMYNHRHPNVMDSRIPRASDADGLYVWDWAPEDKVTFSFSAQKFAYQRDVALAASDQPHEIQLVPNLYVSGTVRDEEGNNLDAFTAIPMIVMRGGPHERRDDAVVCQDGFFEVTSNRGDKGFQVKIEADGYQTHITEIYQPGDRVKPLDVIMKIVEPLSYVVIGVDGKPAAKAEVLVADGDQRVMIDFSNGRSERPMSGKQVTADDEGKFKLQPPTGPRTLMVGTPEGYAEVADLPDKPHKRIQLKKRYAINGNVTADLKNAQVTGFPIRFIHGKSHHIQQSHFERASSDGRFSMKHLPPLPFSLAISLTRDRDGRERRYQIAVEPKSDSETVELNTKVSGQIEIDGENAPNVMLTKSQVTLISKQPTVSLPDELSKLLKKNRLDPNDFEAVNQFFTGNEKTHERMAYAPCFDSYSIRPDKDGRFDFQIMRPGKYEMTIELNPDYERYPFLPLGELKRTVEITSSGLEMGQLKVATFAVPKSGAPVENFMFKNRKNGLPSWLQSFREKYVLLDFWKPWDEESKNDKTKLGQLARKLDPELIAMLSLHTYNRTEGERVSSRVPTSLKWAEGQVDYGKLRAIRKKLGALTPQYYVLLDADGKFIIGGDLEKIKQKITELELQK